MTKLYENVKREGHMEHVQIDHLRPRWQGANVPKLQKKRGATEPPVTSAHARKMYG